jgi:hypothetical protein
MKTIASLLLGLLLSAALAVWATPLEEPEVVCDDLLALMRDTFQAVRHGTPLTATQTRAWKTWNVSCSARDWQQRLALQGPAVSGQALPPTCTCISRCN